MLFLICVRTETIIINIFQCILFLSVLFYLSIPNKADRNFDRKKIWLPA